MRALLSMTFPYCMNLYYVLEALKQDIVEHLAYRL